MSGATAAHLRRGGWTRCSITDDWKANQFDQVRPKVQVEPCHRFFFPSSIFRLVVTGETYQLPVNRLWCVKSSRFPFKGDTRWHFMESFCSNWRRSKMYDPASHWNLKDTVTHQPSLKLFSTVFMLSGNKWLRCHATGPHHIEPASKHQRGELSRRSNGVDCGEESVERGAENNVTMEICKAFCLQEK